jgi:hypothetical protein
MVSAQGEGKKESWNCQNRRIDNQAKKGSLGAWPGVKGTKELVKEWQGPIQKHFEPFRDDALHTVDNHTRTEQRRQG